MRTSLVLGGRLLVQAGTLLLVARLLGPEGFGLFAGVAALAIVMGTLSTFGTHLLVLQEISRDPANRSEILSFAVPTTLLCAAFLLALYVPIASMFLDADEIGIDVLLAIGATELLLQPLLMFPSAEQQGRGHIARSQVFIILPLALRLAAAVTIAIVQPIDAFRTYAYCYFGASLAALVVATWKLRYIWPGPSGWRLPRQIELRRAGGFAMTNLTAIAPAELDKTLALKLLPLAAAGLYATGARVIGSLTLPVIAMMLAAMPRLMRESVSDQARTNSLLRWILICALAYSTALAAALWVCAPWIEWLFGSQYQQLGSAIRWLCLAVPGMALRMAAGASLVSLGLPWMRVAFELVGIAVLVLAAAVLSGYWQLPGMALALACAEWTMALIGGVLIVRIRRRIITQHAT